MDTNQTPLTLTVEDAGRLLGLSRSSAYRAARDGSLPTLKFGSRIVVPKVALDRLLDSAQQQAS